MPGAVALPLLSVGHMKKKLGAALVAGLMMVGCAGPGAGDDDGADLDQADSKNDQIEWFDEPGSLVPDAKTLLAELISADDVGKTFGVDDGHVPYPDTYWPFVDEGIDFDWTGEGGSPLVKYMKVFDEGRTDAAKAWEKRHHGSEVPGVATWFGHCPGWTAAALVDAPLRRGVSVKPDGDGGIAECAPDESGCTRFEIGDINALQAEVYVDADSAFIGARCDTKPADIERDRNGRIVRNGTGCKGLNPGAFLIVAANLMKLRQVGFAIDAQTDFNTDEIWNQPAYRYKVYRYEPITNVEAANLVVHGTKTGDRQRYIWNGRAKGFVLVDLGVLWVTEQGPNLEPVAGTDSTREHRMVAVIELDAPPSSPKARVIGGEYLDDPSVGASRLKVAPFVWTARAAGPERLPLGVGGNNHNPYVKPSHVAKLVELAQK